MADTNKGSATTGNADYAGEDAESIKHCMPDAVDYTDQKVYNRDLKAWRDAVWELAHPIEAKAKRVKGTMTHDEAAAAVKGKGLANMTDTQKAQVEKLVAEGDTLRNATIKVLTYHHNYCLKGYCMAVNLLAIAESVL
jgi:hypothetical protein